MKKSKISASSIRGTLPIILILNNKSANLAVIKNAIIWRFFLFIDLDNSNV